MDKVTFKQYVDSLPIERVSQKSAFVKRIADECGVNESTVYRWINGETRPSKDSIKVISRITRIPIKHLFSCEN